MSITAKTAWIIERNSEGDLSLQGLADACGVSRAHLARAFGAATGRSVIAYLRARRLSAAAETLAMGARDILGVALSAGYNSHEAFTRAFRDQFGVTPEHVRANGSTSGLALQPALDLGDHSMTQMPSSRIVDEPKILIVGMVGHFPRGPSTNGIPNLWQRFVPLMETITNVKPGMPVGVTRDTSEEGGFDYIAALEVTRFGHMQEELKAIEIPARTYAVFTHASHVSRIPDTYRAIWDEALPALGRRPADLTTAYVLERHKPEFDPDTGEGGLEIWIPLES